MKNEPRLNADHRIVYLDYISVADCVGRITMTISLILIAALSTLLWWQWDWFTREFTDREIQKFFDDNG
jgi:hypothetical protein